MKYKTHEGSLYDYTAGVYCGVLVKENIMKKLAKAQARHLEEVKRILHDGVDRNEVFPSMWTLHYPNGEQTIVKFIDQGEDVRQRISLATVAHQPVHYKTVFIASDMLEAKAMADEYFKDHGDE